jgi:UV DNA damage endonuclease
MPRASRTVAASAPSAAACESDSPSAALAARLAPLRLGLCCQFAAAPVKFRTTTATACLRMEPAARAAKLAGLCRENAAALLASLEYCVAHGIGCFRVNSQILPNATHPAAGYSVAELPGGDELIAAFRACGAFAAAHRLRLSFHPDQFVVLSSPRKEVVARSIADIEYQSEVAEWVGADVVNIHAGGVYGDKSTALERFARNLEQLSPRARARLTLENDDVAYTVADLLPLCRREGVPLVYDVHHHRCLSDELSIVEATDAAAATWNREPMVHLSSPKEGWDGPGPQRHHDFIDAKDFPACWRRLAMTVEVEAKAKELAIARLQRDLIERFNTTPAS